MDWRSIRVSSSLSNRSAVFYERLLIDTNGEEEDKTKSIRKRNFSSRISLFPLWKRIFPTI